MPAKRRPDTAMKQEGGDIQPPPRGGTHRAPRCLSATGSDASTPAKPDHPSICPSSLPPGTTTTSICRCPWLVSNRQQLLTQAPAKLLLLGNSKRLTYDLKPHMHVKRQAALICFFLTLMLYFFLLEVHRNGSFLVSILLLHVDLPCLPFRSRLILSSGSAKAEPPILHFLRVSQTQAADL